MTVLLLYGYNLAVDYGQGTPQEYNNIMDAVVDELKTILYHTV